MTNDGVALKQFGQLDMAGHIDENTSSPIPFEIWSYIKGKFRPNNYYIYVYFVVLLRD